MKRLSQTLAFAALSCLAVEAVAQHGNYVLGLEGWGGYTSNGTVPFWLRSNQFGSVPLDGASLSLIGFARKDFESGRDKPFDWGASFEGRANLGQGSNLTLIEGYGKVRMGIFELRAGRSKKITGLCDTTLTSGSWSLSGTNLGIPEVELSVRDFWTLPWFGELFSFKGNFSHGWVGKVQVTTYQALDTVDVETFIHQKSFYCRIGTPTGRVNLIGGFNHQVMWGNESDYQSDDFTLTPLTTYFYVLTGKKFSNGIIQEERQGNHLGSIDLAIDFKFDNFGVLLYRQNFYETGALIRLANIQDGLNGLSIFNLSEDKSLTIWTKILIEFLYTKNQAGRPWSPETSSPYEPYFNHGQYINGWSYKGISLGNPFIGTRAYIRKELAAAPDEFFINNRIMALNLGVEGAIIGINYRAIFSWSQNCGTYWTTDEEQSTGIHNPGTYGIFGKQNQVSTYFHFNKIIREGLSLNLTSAFDTGRLYINSLAILFGVSYKFIL